MVGAGHREPARVEGDVVTLYLTDRERCLLAPIAYVDPWGVRYEVPAGYLTDFASIPRTAWWWLPPDDPKLIYAAAVHDRSYETHELPRLEADRLLIEIASMQGLSTASCALVYSAVRLGGARAYETGPVRQIARKQKFNDMGLLGRVLGLEEGLSYADAVRPVLA